MSQEKDDVKLLKIGVEPPPRDEPAPEENEAEAKRNVYGIEGLGLFTEPFQACLFPDGHPGYVSNPKDEQHREARDKANEIIEAVAPYLGLLGQCIQRALARTESAYDEVDEGLLWTCLDPVALAMCIRSLAIDEIKRRLEGDIEGLGQHERGLFYVILLDEKYVLRIKKADHNGAVRANKTDQAIRFDTQQSLDLLEGKVVDGVNLNLAYVLQDGSLKLERLMLIYPLGKHHAWRYEFRPLDPADEQSPSASTSPQNPPSPTPAALKLKAVVSDVDAG